MLDTLVVEAAFGISKNRKHGWHGGWCFDKALR